MEHIGIDLGKNQSQVCIRTEEGKFMHRRIATSRRQLVKLFGERKKARVLIEASTESEWVARCVEEVGHEVVVADPNYAPMYSHRSRRIKTDRRDAHALAEASYRGTYRVSYRCSDTRRHVRALLASREALVRTRSRYIYLTGALLRRDGHRVSGGGAENYAKRVGKLELNETTRRQVDPLLSQLPGINEQVKQLEQEIEKAGQTNKDVALLCTVPGVGLLTASAFVAVVDKAERFSTAHQLESYLGLVPSEYSSGEKQRRGHITKQGNTRVRTYLVQASWSIMYKAKYETRELRVWAEKVAHRRGSKVAVVALARRLAGILWAMLRDQKRFTPTARRTAA